MNQGAISRYPQLSAFLGAGRDLVTAPPRRSAKRWFEVEIRWRGGTEGKWMRHTEVVFTTEERAVGAAYRRFTPPGTPLHQAVRMVEVDGP
jgi:hypothetical protein